MATPKTPYEAVLQAARDVTKLDSALDAEMLGTALLGSVYAVAEHDRADAVRDFVGEFLAATARRRTPAATAIRQVFAALVPDAAGATAVRPGPAAPRWSDQLGRVRLTGSYAYGDVYGDQTSYLATFAYEDDASGGEEHAVVALVDHNIGIAKDVFVGSAERIVGQVRSACDDDELTWFADVPPARLRCEVVKHLAFTDDLTSLPDGGSLATDRALVGARLALLPASANAVTELRTLTDAERDRLQRDFLGSPEAAASGLADKSGVDEASMLFCLSLIFDHAASFPDQDPLRWSPAVTELFMLDWVHRRAVLDMDDAAMLPRAVRAWAAYAARLRGLPKSAVTQTDEAIVEMTDEFARLYATGERRSAATAAVAQLISDGVDPNDAAAVDAWIEANREQFPPDQAAG
jgi:hypothetical protein